MIPHIHRRSFGSGDRAALAIHCTLGHGGMWRDIGTALGNTLTLHAFDLPDHGRSGAWDQQHDLHDVATDMALAVLDDLGPEPVDLIGHSFGGTVVLRLAIEHPERVRSAAMYEPVFFAAAMADDPDFAADYRATHAAFEQAFKAADLETATRIFNSVWGDGPPWDMIPDQMRAYMVERIHYVPASSPFLVEDNRGLLHAGQFDRAAMPTLIMSGSTSPWADQVYGAITRRLPNVQSHVVDGAGHMGPILVPQAVAQHWATFLQNT